MDVVEMEMDQKYMAADYTGVGTELITYPEVIFLQQQYLFLVYNNYTLLQKEEEFYN
jgi:hypothetical protein